MAYLHGKKWINLFLGIYKYTSLPFTLYLLPNLRAAQAHLSLPFTFHPFTQLAHSASPFIFTFYLSPFTQLARSASPFMTRYTLSKPERLSSLKAIAHLFAGGHSLAKYPIRLVWMEVTDEGSPVFPVQVMFSVSKKKFARAVDRNLIRRRMREAYRLQKPELYAELPEGRAFHLALLYSGTDILEFVEIQKAMMTALKRWYTALAATMTSPPSPNTEL